MKIQYGVQLMATMKMMTMKDNKYIVYKHTTPNGKVYIGITGRTVERRWQGGRNYKSSKHFNNAIQKYGWNNIKHEILFEGLSKENAEEKEIELIDKYKSNNPNFGYNTENGGNSKGKLSEETKKKISNANKGKSSWIKGKHWSDEHKNKISKTLKGRLSPMKGKHWTDEQKANVGTAIICINTGEEFYSIRDASRKTKCDRANITRVLKGIYKQTGGMTFEYRK